ncbi:hypothetical protein CVT26_005529, partial [Gymnopilus dilepis]
MPFNFTKKQRSARPPISILPTDILYRIFGLSAKVDPHADKDSPALIALRNVSHVCARWRSLLLAAPSLWSQALNLTYMKRSLSLEYREEIVRRAGEAEMAVFIYEVGLEDGPFVFEFLTNHWHNIRSLYLYNSKYNSPEHDQMWLEVAQRPSNQLRNLWIYASSRTTFTFLHSVALSRFPGLEFLDICEKNLDMKDEDIRVENPDFPSASLAGLKEIVFFSTY